MSLPFLPGQVFNRNLGKDKFHKSQCFDYRNDVAVHVGNLKSGIGGDLMPGGRAKPKQSCYPRGDGHQVPAWAAFDRQVLSFDAYFQESVHEKPEEKHRIRKCKIYFYLEDDSIQVIEPRVENSGIPQGTLIRRHKIPMPPPNDEDCYTVEDFNVGKEIVLYSKSFHLTGCDKFTYNFLRKLGVTVSPAYVTPDDPYSQFRHKLKESMQPARPYEKQDTLEQFLDNDRRVLRFYCFWDDTESMFGDPRECVLHYFLCDDTVEIREIIAPNSGRDAVPLFLRRQRLPKEIVPMHQPGEVTRRTVLNVFGPVGQGGRYILDSLKTGAVHTDYYHDSDLVIGNVINVWGRKLLICECDEFTQVYYRSKYGIDDYTPIKYKSDNEALKKRETPPYNGFGSEEDSLSNCLSLIPKPPKRDFIKFMKKDRDGLESNVLRFIAKMDTQKPIEVDRRFTISYFLSDDTVLVFEPPQRNSGIIGGKFLERGRVKKPDGVNFYSPQDLYIGAHVEFCNHSFILIDADEYAVNYMEEHAKEFPRANVQLITEKLKDLSTNDASNLKKKLVSGDASNNGVVDFNHFLQTLDQTTNEISTHEIITLGRNFGSREDNTENVETIIATVQEGLRKVNYENFSLMSDACIYQDQHKTGFISLGKLQNIVKTFKLPINDSLLQALLLHVNTKDGDVDYSQFLRFLNWRDNPVTSQKYLPNLAFGVETNARSGPLDYMNHIQYRKLLAKIE